MSEVLADEAEVPTIRPPLQARSREAWDRILDAGRSLLEEGGPAEVTIAKVCARASVTPTAIYARVDGITGLFWAIYEHGLAEVRADEARALAAAEREPAGSRARVVAVVRAMVATFETHAAFLGPIIRYSANDDLIRSRGSQSSMVLIDDVTELLSAFGTVPARDTAKMLHEARIIRMLYGPQWLSAEPESREAFTERCLAMALARLAP